MSSFFIKEKKILLAPGNTNRSDIVKEEKDGKRDEG
jgi:hypothetical protein